MIFVTDSITYVMPLLEDNRLFQKSPVFKTNVSKIQMQYERLQINKTSFAEEALEEMPPLLSSILSKEFTSAVPGMNSSALKAMYLTRVLDKKTLTDTLVLGKRLGVANIGTLIDNAHSNYLGMNEDTKDHLFLYNDIIGCSMISFDGGINLKGQIDGTWLIGFTSVKGVIVAVDFSEENTAILMNDQIDDQNRLDLLSDVVVCWFKDRDWNRPKYKEQTILFLQSSFDEC